MILISYNPSCHLSNATGTISSPLFSNNFHYLHLCYVTNTSIINTSQYFEIDEVNMYIHLYSSLNIQSSWIWYLGYSTLYNTFIIQGNQSQYELSWQLPLIGHIQLDIQLLLPLSLQYTNLSYMNDYEFNRIAIESNRFHPLSQLKLQDLQSFPNIPIIYTSIINKVEYLQTYCHIQSIDSIHTLNNSYCLENILSLLSNQQLQLEYLYYQPPQRNHSNFHEYIQMEINSLIHTMYASLKSNFHTFIITSMTRQSMKCISSSNKQEKPNPLILSFDEKNIFISSQSDAYILIFIPSNELTIAQQYISNLKLSCHYNGSQTCYLYQHYHLFEVIESHLIYKYHILQFLQLYTKEDDIIILLNGLHSLYALESSGLHDSILFPYIQYGTTRKYGLTHSLIVGYDTKPNFHTIIGVRQSIEYLIDHIEYINDFITTNLISIDFQYKYFNFKRNTLTSFNIPSCKHQYYNNIDDINIDNAYCLKEQLVYILSSLKNNDTTMLYTKLIQVSLVLLLIVQYSYDIIMSNRYQGK